MRPLGAILGPTGAGKSSVAMAIAERTGAVIVSVDSMQVYRGMDIGTAKATAEERSRVTHHMLDVADPADAFSVAEFQSMVRPILGEEQRPVLLVGGSGLHFRSIVDPLDFPPTDPEVRESVEALTPDDAVRQLLDVDPDAGGHVDLANPRRVRRALEVMALTGLGPSARASSPEARDVREYRPRVPIAAVGVDPGDQLKGRIERRLEEMVDDGLVQEVAGLMGQWGATASQAVGYREFARALEADGDLEHAQRASVNSTTALARRQRTFFRRDPRIRWAQWDDRPDRVARSVAGELEEAGWTS